MSTSKLQRFDYLDGLRGIAALLVVISHFKNGFFASKNNSHIFSSIWETGNLFIFQGHFCVQIFFILSGFVLAYNSFNRPTFLHKQWFKRVYRLGMPVFITSVIYFLFIQANLFSFDQLLTINYNEWIAGHWVSKYNFVNFFKRFIYDFMLFSDWEFIMSINSSLWTIPIEFYWSYLLFFFFFFINKIKSHFLKNILHILFYVSFLMFFSFTGAEFGILFIGGSMIALNLDKLKIKKNTNTVDYFLLGIVSTLTILSLNNVTIFFSSNHFYTDVFFAYCYIILAIRIQFIQKILCFPFVLWLGKISFALYLLHLLIIGSISSKLFILYPFLRGNFGLIILLLITLIISSTISHAFTIWIDQPCMKLYDKYYQKIILKNEK